MSHQFMQSSPLCRVQYKHAIDEMLGLLRYREFGESEVAHLDSLVCKFDLARLKRRFPEQQGEGDNPCTPNINFIGMPLLALVG